MTKYKIIVNPISGRGTAAEAVPDLDRFLRERNMDFDLVLTERPWTSILSSPRDPSMR